jgi:predicted DNA-binding transcriptional regulator AlpA
MTGKETITFKGLKAFVPYSRTHLDRMEKDGRFPKSFKLSDHRGSPRVWWLREVFEFLENRAKSKADAPK